MIYKSEEEQNKEDDCMYGYWNDVGDAVASLKEAMICLSNCEMYEHCVVIKKVIEDLKFRLGKAT
jgi:hypothetical protein